MKNYNIVLFDLDGTLTDPGIGITNSVMYALKKYGIEVSDRTQLYSFIGPPLTDSFEKYYSFSKEQAKQAVEYYREYFKVTGLFENTVYEGIEELLQNLKKAGKKLLVATSKPEVFAVKILEHFDLAGYFDCIAGADLEGTRGKKGDVIRYALETCGIIDVSNVIMVGDREYDVIGAREVGMDCIGVLFGYGDRQELEAAGAVYIAETVEDIGKFICE